MNDTSIFIVEDETIVAKNIEKHLLNSGYKVAGSATTAEEAVAKISSLKPDLVLMDIKLKGKKDGIEAADEIRKNFRLPVIFLTSYTDEETFQRAKITDPFGYLIKPFDIKELNRTVEIALYKNKINNQLKKNEEEFRNIFENSGIAIAISNPGGQFIRMNTAFCEMFGYLESDLKQMNLRDITHPGDVEISNKLLKGLLNNLYTGAANLEKRYIHKSGETIWALTTVSLVKNLEGKPLHYIAQIQNITQRKKAEEQLARYADELKTLNISKDKFFSIISHDLRSPFNSLLGVTEYMSEYYNEMTKEEIRDSISNIYRSSQKVYNLILNLLEWSRLQSGRLEIEKTGINIKDLCADICDLYKETARVKQIEIINNASENIFVNADKYMIDTVLRNLVSNAIKFTPNEGTIILKGESAGNTAKISVADNGIGINKENQKKLFRIDEQFRRDGTAEEKGTGLGLILCREFIEKNSGTIILESEEGKGSTFIFTLPLANLS